MTGTTHQLDEYRQALTELPELCALLPAALTLRTPTSVTRPAPGSKPPLRLDILQLLDTRDRTGWLDGMEYCDPDSVGILPYLWGWCRDIEATALDTRPQPPRNLPAQPTVANITEWLLSEAEWAARLPQWPELHQGTIYCWKAARKALGVLHDTEQPVRCQICHTGSLDRAAATHPLWRCTACGHEVTVQAVTLRQAAHATATPLRTLQDWARRPGLLAPIGDGPRRRLFDLGQIRALVAERRLRDST